VYIKASNPTPFGTFAVTLRCPHCRKEGTFPGFVQVHDVQIGDFKVGYRICPNPRCQGLVFVVLKSTGDIETSYPPERIDFDTTNIPQRIVNAFEEALTCHAHSCYVAAAMLVRKTLELLCEDRGASGADLRSRIQSLRTKVILPEALFEAIDHLRLLGNDAAHIRHYRKQFSAIEIACVRATKAVFPIMSIESKTYSDVGAQEVIAAIVLTKEILKAVYQYEALLDVLKSLKK